jgi:hypothetical protein
VSAAEGDVALNGKQQEERRKVSRKGAKALRKTRSLSVAERHEHIGLNRFAISILCI